MAPAPGLRIEGGDNFTCLVASGARVACSGSNGDGQQAAPDNVRGYPAFTIVKGITDAVTVGAGSYTACALLADGTIRCWGSNSHGQLGDGTTKDRFSPVEVQGIGDAVALGVGDQHACAIRADRSLWCWGRGDEGEFGNGTKQGSKVPVDTGFRDAIGVAVGATTCVLKDDRTVWCAGYGEDGQNGDGSFKSRSRFVKVKGLDDAVAIDAGFFHTCAIRATGTMVCWGSNDVGTLGDGTKRDRAAPVRAKVPGTVVDMALGWDHTCAVDAAGQAWCWGWNTYQAVNGREDFKKYASPVRVKGATGLAGIDAGYQSSFGRKRDGALVGWGANYSAQLGIGSEPEPDGVQRLRVP